MARVSLKFLASELGLTEGTVSRALNNYADISAETRDRVNQCAKKYGYRANFNARRLATGSAETVAYIMPAHTGGVSEPFVAKLLEGIGQSLSERGWDLLVVQAQSSEAEEEAIRKLASSGRVSGVVLSRPHKQDRRIELLEQLDLPFIVHGRSMSHEHYAWFDVDSFSAFIEVVDHLVSLGHQRIGFIGAPTYYNFAQMRLDGFKEGMRLNHLPDDNELIEISELSDSGGERAANVLLSKANPPTALLCATDMQAIGALAATRAKNLTPGIDVSIIGYDGLDMGKHTNPPLTTMAQPQAFSGRHIGDMLLAIIDGAEPTQFQELRSATFVRRMSDGPVTAITRN